LRKWFLCAYVDRYKARDLEFALWGAQGDNPLT